MSTSTRPSSGQYFEIIDKLDEDRLSWPLGLEQRDEAARARQTDLITNAIWHAFESAAVCHDEKMERLAEAFMRVHQTILHGTTLLSEDELRAPPETTWKQRDKTRKLSLEEHLEEQFGDRIGRGFARRHLLKADPSAYQALDNWMRRTKQPAPSWLEAAATLPTSVNPLEAVHAVSGRNRKNEI